MTDNVEIKPITKADIYEFYGRGLPNTCRGWSVYVDQELAAICGVTIGKGIVVAFSEIKKDVQVPNITIWRTAKKVMERISGLGFSTVYAVAQPHLSTAPSFLARLGFQHQESSVRGEVFKWQTP